MSDTPSLVEQLKALWWVGGIGAGVSTLVWTLRRGIAAVKHKAEEATREAREARREAEGVGKSLDDLKTTVGHVGERLAGVEREQQITRDDNRRKFERLEDGVVKTRDELSGRIQRVEDRQDRGR